jgi:hypothetical protein
MPDSKHSIRDAAYYMSLLTCADHPECGVVVAFFPPRCCFFPFTYRSFISSGQLSSDPLQKARIDFKNNQTSGVGQTDGVRYGVADSYKNDKSTLTANLDLYYRSGAGQRQHDAVCD